MKPPRPEPCCPKCERIARAHGWTPESGESVREFMQARGLAEDGPEAPAGSPEAPSDG